MTAPFPCRSPARAFLAAPLALAILSSACILPLPASGQTGLSDTYRVTEEMKAKLLRPGDLTLRDANFVEALFAIRRAWGINIVVGNDLKGETVSCEFVDAPLFEVLDTILSPRGYGYRPMGNSLVILKLDSLGAVKPLFQRATIRISYADLNEVKEAVGLYLSEYGQIQVVQSARRLIVIDFPDRLEEVEREARELDNAAQDVTEATRAEQVRRQTILGGDGSAGNVPGAGSDPLGMLPLVPSKVAYFDLDHVQADAIAKSIQTILNPTGRISVILKDNRLIVVDTEDRLKLIAEAVHQLDVPRPQVRIDALIYDASLEDIRRCGVNWTSVGKGSNLNATGIAQDQIALSTITAANPTAAAANGALTFMSLGSNLDLHAVINSLAQSKDSRLIADPSVTVYDQEVAKFDAVTEIPFQQLTQGLGGGSIGTTAFREAGTTLNVTPFVAGDQTITMNVNPRFSVLAGLTPQTNQPIIDRREASTTVRVRNGETIVIGGLRQRSAIKNMSGIPYLKDLKYVGQLFRDKQATVRESELLVFITPTIVDMGEVGRDREQCIHAASVPELESIPYPKSPAYPCPPDDWPHRCGLCKKCNRVHRGECDARSFVPRGAPTTHPGAESLPEPHPVEGSSNLRSPGLPEPGAKVTSLRRLPEAPSQVRTACASENLKPVPLIKNSLREKAKPSQASEPNAAAADSPGPAIVASPSKAPLPFEVRRLLAVESERSAAAKRKLTPASPIHVSEEPSGNSRQ